VIVARGILFSLVAVVTTVVVIGACGDDPEPTVLQGIDLATPEAGLTQPFDRNTIVDDAAFTDYETITRDQIQKFLAKTPYSRSSFLETYQSNGVRASDAISNAARQYRINPLVFLVLSETMQGLIGAREYVFPPERVEYIFGCGCFQENNCLADQAGYDRQLDCLGRQLRQSLDDARANDVTAGGWGKDVPGTTLDDQKVTPSNDATAVLYDHNPRLLEGKAGGQWVFWNVWNLYASKLDYFGPLGSTDAKAIGEPCTSDDECGGEGAFCAGEPDYPGGACIYDCTDTQACPTRSDRPPSFCTLFDNGAFCMPQCNRSAGGNGGCRDGYKCIHGKGFDDGAQDVCTPIPQ
jgi:hypothetical protein